MMDRMLCMVWMLILAASSTWGAEKPQFSVARHAVRAGSIVEAYGLHLGPAPVRATLGGRVVTVLFESDRQVNLRLPADLNEGKTALQLCVRDVCSDPVMMDILPAAALVKLQGQAY